MAKELRGELPSKFYERLRDRAKKKETKWSDFATKLLERAGDDPGKKLPDLKNGKMKKIRLHPGKKAKKAAEKYMKTHDLGRKHVLGYALARGWDLS